MLFEINYKTDIFRESGKLISKNVSIKELIELDTVTVGQLINNKTNKPYRNKCVLYQDNKSMIVEHSYEQIKDLKTKNNRTIVKGYKNYENDKL